MEFKGSERAQILSIVSRQTEWANAFNIHTPPVENLPFAINLSHIE